MQEKTTTNAIIEGVIWKQLLIFFLPVALGTFFQQMYNTIDALVLGNFVGMTTLAAVGGITSSVINLIVSFFVSVSTGATVALAMYYGAEDREAVSRVVHTTAALTLIMGVFLTVVGILYIPGTLRLLNQPEELMEDSVQYMRIYFAGVLPSLVYNIGSGLLRAVGDSKRPMTYLIIGCILNIVLDLLFVAALGWGVTGAALATIISQATCAVLVVMRLVCAQDSYRLYFSGIRLYGAQAKAILRVGLPAALQTLMYSVSNTFIQASINLYGANTVAAWTVLGKIDGLGWMALGALGISVTTFVGQNYGAGRLDRVRKSIHVSFGLAFFFCAIFSAALLTLGTPLYRAFGADEAVLELGRRMLLLFGPFYFLYAPVEILSGAMRGVGKVLVPTMITCVGICLLRIVWTMVAYRISTDFEPVALSYPVSWICASIAFLLYYKLGRWLPEEPRAVAGDIDSH